MTHHDACPVRQPLHQVLSGRLNRREALRRAAALGVAPAALAHAVTQAAAQEAATPTAADSASTIPGPPWEGGTRGGTGRVAWPDDNITLDPPLAYDLGGYYGIANFHRGLLFYGLNTEPQLDLAESMDIADDATSYRFRIKPGVTFHNGRALTAADFKFTWERASSPEIGSWVQGFLGAVTGHADFVAGTASEISGIKVADDHTIELQLDRPDVTIPGVLGIPPFYVLPGEEVRAGGEAFSFTLGTGPWQLDQMDQSQRLYRCSRFADYIYADQLPYFDGLEWQWGVTQDLEAQRVQRGELEATGGALPGSVVLQLQQSNVGDQLQLWDSLTMLWMEFDVTRPPFDDKRVRQAFNYAYNKERLQRLLIKPTGHLYPPALLGYNPDLQVYTYDPERARSLLKEAGYESGLAIEVPILADEAAERLQLLQQDMKDVGVTLTLKADPQGVYDYGSVIRDTYRLWARGWGMGLPDPSEIVNSLAGSEAPSNFGGYGNPDVDALGREGQTIADLGQRGEIYAEIEKLLVDDAAFLFEGVTQWATLRRPELRNFIWEPVVYEHWDRYWIQSP